MKRRKRTRALQELIRRKAMDTRRKNSNLDKYTLAWARAVAKEKRHA